MGVADLCICHVPTFFMEKSYYSLQKGVFDCRIESGRKGCWQLIGGVSCHEIRERCEWCVIVLGGFEKAWYHIRWKSDTANNLHLGFSQ